VDQPARALVAAARPLHISPPAPVRVPALLVAFCMYRTGSGLRSLAFRIRAQEASYVAR
jgi:hypothetical protein